MAMYNLEKEFKKFYKDHVVLSRDEKNNLFSKKNTNIERLKEGLKEYNEENKTDYKLTEEPIIQGSIAMSTIIQNDNKDYDIDVAIVFDKENIPEGTISTKNIVVNALKRKCTGFKKEPEAKTNCVRIEYAEGYHIDFAIYRRYKDENDNFIYEHCGSEWRIRDPRAITKWFLEQNKQKNYNLREVVRLLKMFTKSREKWVNMPGGLILSVLANEQFQSSYDRMDERFYYTIKAIRDRLATNKDVYNPVEENQSLKLVSQDDIKINNLFNRLDEKLSKLDVLFMPNCTRIEALEAWKEFFNHSFWEELIQSEGQKKTVTKSYASFFDGEEYFDYKDTEEFIEYLFPINIQYQLEINCKIKKKGQIIGLLSSFLKRREPLLPGNDLEFYAHTNVPKPYRILWKVKNQGTEAKRRNQIRGQIVETNQLIHHEVTSFKGNHYVECYIVKDGVCVARNRIPVPIKIS